MALVSKKRVILLGNDGAVLFGPGMGGGMEREASIAWSATDFTAQLAGALSRRNTGSPVVVMFDGADQAYRKEENIPKLSAFDRPRFIQRKLDQAFPNYPIRAAFPVPGPKGAQPTYLFAAVPETENIDKVSEALLDAGVPIAGFGLLPLESAGLVTALADKIFSPRMRKSRWAVLVSQHENGGLRQVVVKDGRLALTRMTPASGQSGAGWVEDVADEFKATLTYIARFGYTAEDGLDVIIICGDAEKELFEQRQMPVSNFRCIKAGDALTTIGARGRGLGDANYGDVVHAGWVAKKSSLTSPIEVKSLQAILKPRQMMTYAAMGLGATMVLLAGLLVVSYAQVLPLESDISDNMAKKSRFTAEFAEQEKLTAALPVQPMIARRTLAIDDSLTTASVKVGPVLTLLKKVVPADIVMQQLSLAHDPQGALTPPGAQAKPQVDPHGLLTITMKFGVSGKTTLEERVARTEHLANALRAAFPGYNVEITAQFGRVSRTGRFEGKIGSPVDGASPSDDMDSSAEIELKGVPL